MFTGCGRRICTASTVARALVLLEVLLNFLLDVSGPDDPSAESDALLYCSVLTQDCQSQGRPGSWLKTCENQSCCRWELIELGQHAGQNLTKHSSLS
ncbi:protein of unknown function [Alcaligenes faecalis subsp. faecalis]|nr:protein of unknown function [Alcaligenes faecalis subsp. faecalis]